MDDSDGEPTAKRALPTDDADVAFSLDNHTPEKDVQTSPIAGTSKQQTSMLPPDVPVRASDSPGMSFAPRPAGARNAKKRMVLDTPSDRASSPMPSTMAPRAPGGRKPKKVLIAPESPLADAASRRRLQKRRVTPSSPTLDSPPKVKRPKKKETLEERRNQWKANPFFHHEAEHSGDEVSEGTSGVVSDEYDSDRAFINRGEATQAPKSYNQAAIYAQSLRTQVPGGGPAFKSRKTYHSRPAPRLLSSSPEPDPDDQYSMGSFIVDDEEISFQDTSEAM